MFLFQNFSSLQFIDVARDIIKKGDGFQNFSSLQFIIFCVVVRISFNIFQNFSSLQFMRMEVFKTHGKI